MTELTVTESCKLREKVRIEVALAKAFFHQKAPKSSQEWDDVFHEISKKCRNIGFEFRQVAWTDEDVPGCNLWLQTDSGIHLGTARIALYEIFMMNPEHADRLFDDLVSIADDVVERAERYEVMQRAVQYIDEMNWSDLLIIKNRDYTSWVVGWKGMPSWKCSVLPKSFVEAKDVVNSLIDKMQAKVESLTSRFTP